ncbi:hypothetical protein RhiirB3_454667 [Rhizophagus irregularis]|nr:hypothetical protein RhiirB3_454667 [Rhizophagus irregularis]
MIDAVNNLFLETFHSYTGCAHVSGSGDQKRLDDITALFKKYGNIQSCCLHTRANAKVQQACIVFMMMLFLPNTSSTSNKPSIVIPPACGLLCDIHLAPLVREIGAMAVNVPLSLNSYKLKKWAYITFKSQQMMDAAMEQSIALQKHVLTWELLQNTNKLCHRCAKLGYAPTACPLNNSRDGTLSSGSKGSKPLLVDLNCSQIQEILTLLKSLQEDMTNVHARVYALELADQRMSRLEQQVFGHKQDDVTTPDPSDSSSTIDKERVLNQNFNDPLFDTLFSDSPIPNSFNISSFNVNGLKSPGQGPFKIDLFSQKHISFGGIIDTHLSPKQMKFLSKCVSDYTLFHFDLDPTKHGCSSGGFLLFIHNSLATHIQYYESHSSRNWNR